jgi:Rps23 Pro-64 3,4-dihydroxylase Tpa1-like proline 4-hydroxylase
VEHEVLGVKRTAREERLALSFWFLKPRPGGARS